MIEFKHQCHVEVHDTDAINTDTNASQLLI